MIITESEAKRITDKILTISRADACTVSLSGREEGNVRFALNSVTTSGHQDDLTVTIQSSFGKRTGSASLNELSDPALTAAIRKSEEIAKLAPEDPEYQPPLGPQRYAMGTGYVESTAKAPPAELAELCEPVLEEAKTKNVSSAGYLRAGGSCSAMATNKGLFAYDRSTRAIFTTTVRTNDGNGSGWAGKCSHDMGRLDTPRLAKIAVQKSIDSRNPLSIAPGKYTVILESSAVSDLLQTMLGMFDARNADEGRSFLSKKGGGNKLNEKICNERVNIYSDPSHVLVPGGIYSTDGLPSGKRTWIEGGVVKELVYTRYWAQKSNRPAVPQPTNLILKGGKTSIEDMIKNTKRGILVTRIWYLREVDPRTLVQTGLTRDGTFLIEDGKIRRCVRNFRFNESPIAMLNNIEAIGPSERATGSEIGDWPMLVPPLMVRDFTFSSLSDAV